MADKSPVKHKEREEMEPINMEWSNGDFCLVSFKHERSQDISNLRNNLQIVCCSIGTSQTTEESKDQFISLLHKLHVNPLTLQPSCGVVSSISINSSTPVQFYTCLLDPTDTTHRQSGPVLKYLFCCMSARKKGLELFREELDTFTENMKSLLLKISTSDTVTSDSKIYKYMESWTSILSYLSQLIPKCKEELPVLLHASLNNEVKISGDDAITVQQLQRFVESCRVNALMEAQPNILQLIEIAPVCNYVNITASSRQQKIEVSTTEANEFTRKWSIALLTQDMDPFFLKKVMEDYKFKIVQDMNALKRLLREAETDYYSLYKCYTFLQSTGNVDLLLKCSLREAESQGETETTSVVKALMQFIGMKGRGSNKPAHSSHSKAPIQLL